MARRATTQVGYLKIGIYGGPGSGKTLTALKLATSLGKTYLLDTEHGSDFYAAEYTFDVPDEGIDTKSLDNCRHCLAEAIEQKYDCFIVDQITHIWDGRQEEYIAEEHEKQSKVYGIIERTGNMPFQAWRKIKKPYKAFIHELIDAPLHVFILGRLSAEYKVSGDTVEKIGEKMNAEKDTPYEPHLLIKMSQVPNSKPARVVAYIEKDRSQTISGEVFTNPGPEMIAPILAKLGKTHAPLPTGKEDNAEEIGELLITGLEPESSQLTLITVLAKKGGIEEEKIRSIVKGLNRANAGILITRLTLGDYSDFKE